MSSDKSSSPPLVSIGLPVFNGERTLRRTIDSLLAQTCEDLELIITDNASTDSTESICAEYAGRDHRVRYHRHAANLGHVASMNHLFELSSADYFMWATDEDLWAPDYVQSCIEVLGQSEEILLAGTWGEFVDSASGQLIFTDEGCSTVGLPPGERFKRHKAAIHSGSYAALLFHGVYRRESLGEVMPVWNLVLTDQLLLARLSLLGEFQVVPKVLMTKRRRNTPKRYEEWLRDIGVAGALRGNYPHLVRDLLYQKIIFQSDKLSLKQKVSLSYWSLTNYNTFRPDFIRFVRGRLRGTYHALGRLSKLGLRPRRTNDKS